VKSGGGGGPGARGVAMFRSSLQRKKLASAHSHPYPGRKDNASIESRPPSGVLKE